AGTILGDIFGSFVKRRLGLKRGQPAPGLDQLGFVCFALALSIAVYGIPAWLDAATLISLLLITAFLHVGTNYLAYLLGLKREPY
ncbi:MAG TPA: CDP-archaeol synthase, partial [Nitrososphaeria archaeon]|nr:CDP-archaeol synthase [Nitrososphaeria archaeon]